MTFFRNKRKDFSIQPPKQQVGAIPFFVSDSFNIDFTLNNLTLTADLTLTGVTAGTYGSSTQVPVLQIDQWGRVTGVTLVTISGGGGTYTVNNGLTENPANNFQLGGSLIQNTIITSTGFKLDLISNVNFPGYALGVQNSGTGSGIFVQSVGGNGAIDAINNNGTGVVGRSSNGYGIRAVSNGNGTAFQAAQTKSTTNVVETIAQLLRETSSLGANGIGGSLDFYVETDNSSIIPLSHKLISKWTNATFASRVSQFEIEGVNNAITSRLFALTGAGQLILDKYGQTPALFPGTPVWSLGVDASGNVVEFTPSGGGGVTSVNSGINISVDNTNPAAPIINSLSDRYKTSSTTSNSVSNGIKTFTVDANLSYIPLQEVLVVHNPANHMHGEVVSYSGTTLVVDIKHHTGSGTYTSWLINLDGTPVDAITGSGTINELAYFTGGQSISSLPVATYPNLTEVSYLKGVTSSVQNQLNSKVPNTRQVATTGSLTGGGDLSADRTLSLVNDSNSPGANKVYGTDALGTRNWVDVDPYNTYLYEFYNY